MRNLSFSKANKKSPIPNNKLLIHHDAYISVWLSVINVILLKMIYKFISRFFQKKRKSYIAIKVHRSNAKFIVTFRILVSTQNLWIFMIEFE